ncbi:hypothetical protein A2U01_0075542 [Trifolium medium]|uniref:C2H2-type domain-containing protein n=1 Tax=Trifolium medium TaxID=97028 RepID=A0A392SZK0_9FABA|nr:hypothetical protein [Trifolium medium]
MNHHHGQREEKREETQSQQKRGEESVNSENLDHVINCNCNCHKLFFNNPSFESHFNNHICRQFYLQKLPRN